MIGTVESQIILGPGHHQLHLQNKDLNYNATQGVDVDPGETTKVPSSPRQLEHQRRSVGQVFIDGVKAGETPMANVPIRLGLRDRVQESAVPERSRDDDQGGTPATVSVDFNKDK